VFRPFEGLVKVWGKAFVTRGPTDPTGKPKTDKVEVKTGVRNDRDVEILSGAKEGDRVLIKPAAATENEVK
jgi:hypothetical protein